MNSAVYAIADRCIQLPKSPIRRISNPENSRIQLQRLFNGIFNQKRYSLSPAKFSLDSHADVQLDFGPTTGMYSVYNLTATHTSR